MCYPEFERSLLNEVNDFFDNWQSLAKQKNFIKNYTADNIISDGFYPYYTKQKVKVLFVGRESLSLEDGSYLEQLFPMYKADNYGGKSINASHFHRLMFYITYGLNHNCPLWSDVPYASELADDFATENGISFAFMNLSKFTNDSDNWQADWALIDNFTSVFANEPVNLFNQQIDILNPDLIITMNLESRLSVLGYCEPVKFDNVLSRYHLKVGGKNVPLFDTFHFSAVKSDFNNYYKPIMQAWQDINQ